MFLKQLFDRLKSQRRSAVINLSDTVEQVSAQPKVRVLFVCMANICRSPTARGVFEKLVEEAGLAHAIAADSAGTYAYQIGKSPDQRAVAAASKRGYDLSGQRARRIDPNDFQAFDYILAMDGENLADMRGLLTPGSEHKVKLFMGFAGTPGRLEVPDPYYGGGSGFERVLDLVEDAARGLLAHIRAQHRL